MNMGKEKYKITQYGKDIHEKDGTHKQKSLHENMMELHHDLVPGKTVKDAIDQGYKIEKIKEHEHPYWGEKK